MPVIEVDPPRRLVYTWQSMPKKKGLESLTLWWRFTPGAVARRDYGTSTVPPGYAK